MVSFMTLIRRCGGDGKILLSQRDDATVYCSNHCSSVGC
jgi:hypothetical protein